MNKKEKCSGDEKINKKFESKMTASEKDWLVAFYKAEKGDVRDLNKISKVSSDLRKELQRDAKKKKIDGMRNIYRGDLDVSDIALKQQPGCSNSMYQQGSDDSLCVAVEVSAKREEHLASRGVRGGLKKKLTIIENDAEKLNELIQNEEEVRKYTERGYRFMYENKLYGFLMRAGLTEAGLHEAVLFKDWMKKNNLEIHSKNKLEGVVS